MNSNNTKVIAYYLPQFHPIEENDNWWGKGFTEWTSVAKAKPLFKGHYQPRIPSDLGFYDLRLVEVQEAQVKLAREAGISAFCYWHYWFGNGKQLLEKPLQEILKRRTPDFPFCLAWANHSWLKKNWNSKESRFSKKLLLEQIYPGKEDIDAHFYKMLPAFSDNRYFRINNKLVFVFYSLETLVDAEYFIERWRTLALKNGLPDFFFIGHTANSENLNCGVYNKINAINLHILDRAFSETPIRRLVSWALSRPLNVVNYSQAIKKLEDSIMMNERVFPTIYPNWDVSPRIGSMATIMHNSTPEIFKYHVSRTLKYINNKKSENRVIFLKSWNEWAEGNYMEPDLKFGKQYIFALKEALVENDKQSI